MKSNLKTLFLPLSLLALTSCSGGGTIAAMLGPGGGDGYGGGYDASAEEMEGGEVRESAPADGAGGEKEASQSRPQAGQLTCSALDDNADYDFWRSLLTGNQGGEGEFSPYAQSFAFNTFHRIALTVQNGSNVKIKLKGENRTFNADTRGLAYLFSQEEKESYDVEISYRDGSGELHSGEYNVKDGDTIDLGAEKVNPNLLEIMFVIDATGSMGDEMSYLKSEIDDVVSNVKEHNPTADVSLAMMVYRDKGDDYVTRYSDFTKDIAKQQDFLKNQRAGGGGDFEEAVDVALTEAAAKQWSSNSTKLLFHVADAPSHDKDVPTWNTAALAFAEKGIKVITVASSGIDTKTEYFFRSQSLLTAGQYVYLTDHSGIGYAHHEPNVKEPLPVEYLNACLIRLIDGYYSGEFAEPVSIFNSQQQGNDSANDSQQATPTTEYIVD